MYVKFLKPILDITTALCAFILLLPIFCLLVMIIAVSMSGNPFFVQPRLGKSGRRFLLLKFKSMNDRRDEAGDLLPDEQRLTKIGNLIRKLSLDELPQLINVLKGDMSLIGPRPLLTEYAPLYNEFQNRRHEVKPGITGWAQVNGRNQTTWNKRFELDVWYVEHVSLTLDVKIVWLTICKVLKRDGVSSDSSATMEKFKGNA